MTQVVRHMLTQGGLVRAHSCTSYAIKLWFPSLLLADLVHHMQGTPVALITEHKQPHTVPGTPVIACGHSRSSSPMVLNLRETYKRCLKPKLVNCDIPGNLLHRISEWGGAAAAVQISAPSAVTALCSACIWVPLPFFSTSIHSIAGCLRI